MRRLIALVITLAIAQCAAPPPPPPPVLTLNITGSTGQNPDSSGAGTTVAVRVYELAATGKFQAADVYTLTGSESTALGTDEVTGSTQYLLAPGQKLSQVLNLPPGVNFVGIAVLFQKINQSTWKLTAPVAPHGPSSITLQVQGLTASLQG
jgi:type VI secretion system protein VasD